ncbi:AAA family ATPase [Duganella sp. LjRoot269]|uniref:AAA family ATPase n=1 Tax=Duganella sp. LjRoot269 TaxID=3342305 RepID=UPI003ECCB06F
MKNWKISKLKIQAFKAFPSLAFDFETSSLLTLDGPNGYGKTSVFDAIELLLTGKITRVSDLYTVVASKQKKKYKDNLYWNTRTGDKDIEIRVELTDTKSGDQVFFIRRAKKSDLEKSDNNKPDNFEIFSLHQMPSFDSEEFGQALKSSYFDEYFGENFCSNYSMLNYLQQGQSKFIFAKKATERKESLELLLKTKDVQDKIEFCKDIERNIGNFCSTAERSELTQLQQKVEDLSKIDLSPGETNTYEKIPTREPVPSWNSLDPYSELNEEQFAADLNTLSTLSLLVSTKAEIQIRLENIRIENYIAQNDSLLLVTMSIGQHLDRYENLNTYSQRLTLLRTAQSALEKSPTTISAEDLESIQAAGVSLSERLGSKVIDRDSLTKQMNGRSAEIVKLNGLRTSLVESHRHVMGEDDTHCALCGTDWETISNLADAVKQTTDRLNEELGALAIQIQDIHLEISQELDPIKITIASEVQSTTSIFAPNLYLELHKNVSRFEQIRALDDALSKASINYSNEFTTDPAQLLSRKEDVVSKIRATKKPEGEEPAAGWNDFLVSLFVKYDDFYAIEEDSVQRKRLYITSKHRQKQNSTLQSYQKDLLERTQKFKAAENAKERVNRLRNTLVEAEREYAAKTISNIELIFHIYSGRLIQNYQRGLGLFILDGDGKQLQFSTAEQSEHDATLSMSTGQLSALSLAFFLSLNRVYSESSFVLIDDPAQSLDDINIASLTDLLRCELKDRQLIISSHEDDIASYMRYRFDRAGLNPKLFHMQSHTAAPNSPPMSK